MSKCKGIVLNKPFEGSYTREEGKIAHEIVDFFLTDNGSNMHITIRMGNFLIKMIVNINICFFVLLQKSNVGIRTKKKKAVQPLN